MSSLSTDVKLTTVSYIILYVKDVKQTVPFYRDILGFKVKLEDGGWIEFESGATTLCLHESSETVTPHAAQPCVVFNVDDIQAAYNALKGKGVKFTREPHVVCEADGKSGKSAEFADLDGNRLSIFGYEK